MERGRDINPGGHGVDQGVGYIHIEEQGTEGWGLASRGKLCDSRRRPEMAA